MNIEKDKIDYLGKQAKHKPSGLTGIITAVVFYTEQGPEVFVSGIGHGKYIPLADIELIEDKQIATHQQ
jgi:hypothetical protein